MTINLFAPNPIATPSSVQSGNPSELFGMRPEAVGTVSYFELSNAASNSFRTRGGDMQRLRIALPGASPVVCSVNEQVSADGLLVLQGASEGGGLTSNCNLVVDKGQVSGILETSSGRYRIVPLGTGNVHAVVKIRTEAFPNEGRTLRRD